MKKIIYVILYFLLLLSFFVPKQEKRYAYAAETTDADEMVDNVIDAMELDGYEKYMEKLKEEYDISFPEKIKKIVEDAIYQKSETDARYFLRTFLYLLIGNVGGYLARSSIILIVCILLSLLKNMSSGFASRSTEKIVYLASYGVIITIVLSIIGQVVAETTSLIEIITLFTDSIFPPLLAVMTAIGSVSATGVYQPALLLFSSLIPNVINSVVLPLFYLSFVLTVVGHLNEEIKLKKTVKTARSVAEWTLSLFFGLFTVITTAKGIAGNGSDSFAVRSAKFALSGYVPVVGNYLKDGFDIVITSCIVVKNAVGVTAIVILILTVIVPVVKILLSVFALRLTASVVEPFGEERVSAMLYDVSDCLKLLLILILCIAFSLFTVLMLIILSCNGGYV